MTAILSQPHLPHPKKWTKREYLELIEHGTFENQRVFLFRGEIIEMAPHGHPHAFGIAIITRYLTTTFPEPYHVRVQLSFITPGDSVPEPDAVVCTRDDALHKPHPSRAELIVEVADSSIAIDRAKAEEYAGARVPEYWIINTEARHIEVYRELVEDPAATFGHRYAQKEIVRVGKRLAPLSRPDALIEVSSFFG